MIPAPLPGNVAPVAIPVPIPAPIQAPAQPAANPAPPPPVAPQMRHVTVPDDPRGIKRGRENGPQDSDEPVLKQARTEPAVEQVDPTQQKLINAIESGDLPGLHKLLGQSRQLLSSYFPGVDGLTPLCLAARCGKKVIASFFVELRQQSRCACQEWIHASDVCLAAGTCRDDPAALSARR